MSTLSFRKQIEDFTKKLHGREAQLYENIQEHVGQSIVYGSPISGAPGQPVKTGRLRDSWVRDRRGKRVVRWSTDVPYAPIIEDNWRGAQLRSLVGGFHSVKITRQGWQAIVNFELRLLTTVQAGPGNIRRDPSTGRFA